MSCPLTNAVIGLIGVLVGGLIGHWLAGVRDIAARKRAFCSFMQQWRTEIFMRVPSPAGYYTQDAAIIAFQAQVPSFRAEVERARGVFTDCQRFRALTDRVAALKAEDWQGKTPCDVILEAIDELIRFAA